MLQFVGVPARWSSDSLSLQTSDSLRTRREGQGEGLLGADGYAVDLQGLPLSGEARRALVERRYVAERVRSDQAVALAEHNALIRHTPNARID